MLGIKRFLINKPLPKLFYKLFEEEKIRRLFWIYCLLPILLMSSIGCIKSTSLDKPYAPIPPEWRNPVYEGLESTMTCEQKRKKIIQNQVLCDEIRLNLLNL